MRTIRCCRSAERARLRRPNRFTVENSDRNSLSVADAEKLPGILQPQVSRWRTALGVDPEEHPQGQRQPGASV